METSVYSSSAMLRRGSRVVLNVLCLKSYKVARKNILHTDLTSTVRSTAVVSEIQSIVLK